MDEQISVIVPVYNVENYLKKSIDSIIHQTYTNLEIILVDDGSTDTCPEICDEYKALDSRIIVIHQKNAGLSAARNTGLDIAKGKYIIFVDSDDFIDSKMCELLYQRLKQDRSDLSICSVRCIDENNHEIWPSKFTLDGTHFGLQNELLTGADVLKRISFRTNGNWIYVVAWNKLYKKELFQNYRYPEGKIHEDEFAIHHIVSQCALISIIENRLYNYLQRDGSITGQLGYTVKYLDVVEAFIERYFFLKQLGYTRLSKDALLSAYGSLYNYLCNLSQKQLKKTAKDYVKIVTVELIKDKNLRAVKLTLKYLF